MSAQTLLNIPRDIPIRDRWARLVTSNKLSEDWHKLFQGVPESDPLNDSLPFRSGDADRPQIPESFDENLVGSAPKSASKIKVGIVGAGCAGLFTGMILDFLNRKVSALNIQYEILEANKKERVGGRLFTYEFPQDDKAGPLPHQYYDVGAMRFPEIPIMDRTFSLFKHLGMDAQLMDYHLVDKKAPWYFNDVQRIGKADPTKEPDPFHMNAGLFPDDQIDAGLMKIGTSDVMSTAMEKYRDELKKGIEKGTREGWDYLMKADFLSTRQHLSLPSDLPSPFKGLGYNYNSVTWLETFEYGTGWYDQSLSETVLESMDFDYPDPDPKKEWPWKCVDGGAQQIAIKMEKKLTNPPVYQKVVTKISTTPTRQMRVEVQGEDKPREYFALFNSTTLGALQQMDLTEAGLTYGTKQAIRCLGYGASCKVAIRFDHAWWMKSPFNLNHGGSSKTDLPLRVCVYPSYNIKDDYDKPAVLLCSYSWAQDAQRIGTLINSKSPSNEETLKELLLRNLALLHSSQSSPSTQNTPQQASGYPPYEEVFAKISKAYMTHHAWDWYRSDPYTPGAFAYFGPGQFSNMWPEITRPNGWLWLIGEAASAHHAWVVGALESSVRAVWQFLKALEKTTKEKDPKQAAIYAEAAALLDSKDEANRPFAPLPLEMDRNVMVNDALLGFVENTKELSDAGVFAHK